MVSNSTTRVGVGVASLLLRNETITCVLAKYYQKSNISESPKATLIANTAVAGNIVIPRGEQDKLPKPQAVNTTSFSVEIASYIRVPPSSVNYTTIEVWIIPLAKDSTKTPVSYSKITHQMKRTGSHGLRLCLRLSPEELSEIIRIGNGSPNKLQKRDLSMIAGQISTGCEHTLYNIHRSTNNNGCHCVNRLLQSGIDATRVHYASMLCTEVM